MGNCTLFRLHFQQSTKLFSKIAKMNQSYWDMIGEISIFQPNWNMQKHSYAKSRKSIYFQTQTKIPFFHLRGFLIFNPTGCRLNKVSQFKHKLWWRQEWTASDSFSQQNQVLKNCECQEYWGNNFIEWPNGSDSFMISCNIVFIPAPSLRDPALASRLFMQISCPILAIVQHKVTIANK